MIKKKKLFKNAVYLWAAVISVLSLIPSDNIPNMEIFQYDKVGHFLLYFIFAYLLLYNNKSKVFALILSSSYGILMEIFQLVVPGREFSLADIVFNVLGAFAAAVVMGSLERKKKGSIWQR